MDARDALEVVREYASVDDSLPDLAEAIAVLTNLVERAGEPARYFADGPQGCFYADDLTMARELVNAYDKQDDWTITDLHDPTGSKRPTAPGASHDR